MEPEEQKLKQIRTFQGDIAETIQGKNESLVSIQRAEVARREASGQVKPEEEKHSGRALLLAVLTLVFTALGLGGTYFAYTTYKEKTALPATEVPANQFFSVANVSDIDASTLNRQAMLGVFAIERSREREGGSAVQIQMRRGNTATSSIITPEDFLFRLSSHAPNALVRALGDDLMLGVLGSQPPHTFIIIRLSSFANAFAGMLEWEDRLVEDLLPIFADGEILERVPTDSPWLDLVVENRDTRILKDVLGNTVLIYGFFDNELLILTDTESSWRSIAQRLEAQKLSR